MTRCATDGECEIAFNRHGIVAKNAVVRLHNLFAQDSPVPCVPLGNSRRTARETEGEARRPRRKVLTDSPIGPGGPASQQPCERLIVVTAREAGNT